MDTQTPEQIAQHYKSMGDSVWYINSVIANTLMPEETLANKKAAVKRNVDHLELMLAKDFWTTENMSAVRLAIAAGKTFVG